MSLSDHPVDIVNESASKLALISCCLCHTAPDCHIEFTARAIDGLQMILTEIEVDLVKAVPYLVYQPTTEV